MVMSNANLENKKFLRTLPQDPEPTIPQMADACTKASSLETTLAVAMSKGMKKAVVNVNNVRCFSCGQLGHFQANCPHLPPGCLDSSY